MQSRPERATYAYVISIHWQNLCLPIRTLGSRSKHEQNDTTWESSQCGTSTSSRRLKQAGIRIRGEHREIAGGRWEETEMGYPRTVSGRVKSTQTPVPDRPQYKENSINSFTVSTTLLHLITQSSCTQSLKSTSLSSNTLILSTLLSTSYCELYIPNPGCDDLGSCWEKPVWG